MHCQTVIKTKYLYLNVEYHPDHLGSSSYITDRMGKISQHTEYIAFGEVLFDEHTTEVNMPYLFNGKELDSETGLYYYGARYYDARVSLWLGTDPLSGYNPIMETEHYIDGQHNGGIYNPMNFATYSYTYQNPILYIDPNGKQNINNASKPNIIFYSKQTYDRERIKWINFERNTIKNNISTKWKADWFGYAVITGTKNLIIDRYIKGEISKNLKIAKNGEARKMLVSTLLKKATDIEVKYRLTNLSTVKGYEWYGDVYINRFKMITGDDNWDVVNYKGKSPISTYLLVSDKTELQEGIFFKGQNTPFYINIIGKGEKELRKSGILYPSKNDIIQKEKLPLKNQDKR